MSTLQVFDFMVNNSQIFYFLKKKKKKTCFRKAYILHIYKKNRHSRFNIIFIYQKAKWLNFPSFAEKYLHLDNNTTEKVEVWCESLINLNWKYLPIQWHFDTIHSYFHWPVLSVLFHVLYCFNTHWYVLQNTGPLHINIS